MMLLTRGKVDRKVEHTAYVDRASVMPVLCVVCTAGTCACMCFVYCWDLCVVCTAGTCARICVVCTAGTCARICVVCTAGTCACMCCVYCMLGLVLVCVVCILLGLVHIWLIGAPLPSCGAISICA